MDASISARADVVVREGLRGRGVFAARAFAADEEVEVCPTVEIPRAEAKGVLADYVFDSARSRRAVVLVLGYGMLYNHSADPNVEYTQDEPTTIDFRARRAVKAGEELTISYGGEWWDTRGLEPA